MAIAADELLSTMVPMDAEESAVLMDVILLTIPNTYGRGRR